MNEKDKQSSSKEIRLLRQLLRTDDASAREKLFEDAFTPKDVLIVRTVRWSTYDATGSSCLLQLSQSLTPNALPLSILVLNICLDSRLIIFYQSS